MRPGVSVVIPTVDRVGLLRQTLATALYQVGVAHEVIVVDDGSVDGTAEYLRSVEDERLRVVVHGSRSGVARARNAGLGVAEHEWVAFLDDDDLWAPDKLASQLEAAGRNPSCGWVTVGAVDVDERLVVTGGAAPPRPQKDTPRLLCANNVPGGGSGTMLRTALVRDLGGFDPELQTLADWDLWVRVSPTCDMASVHRPLVGYRVHAMSMSHTDDRFRTELAAVQHKHADTARAYGVEMDEADILTWYGTNLLRAQALRGARASARAVVRRRPGARSAAKAALVHVAPRVLMRVQDRKRSRAVPPGYRAEAERWLRPLRAVAGVRASG